MNPKLISIQYKNDYLYHITFADKREGIVDFKPFLWGEAFERIKDKEFFRKAFIDKMTGTITWPNGVDISPETLHRQLSN